MLKKLTMTAAAALMVMTAASQAVAQETGTVDNVARDRADTAQQNAVEAQNAASIVAGGLVAVAARIAALELSVPPDTVTAITVVCGIDTIAGALALATAGTPLTITVDGTCTEEVEITADDITVQGNSIADQVIGGFTITGAHRVTIKSLTIRDGTTSFPVGVHASRGASVVLDGLVISGQGGIGIFLSRNAYADIIGVDVTNPASGSNALGLSDGAAIRARDSTFSSANGASDDGAAVGLFRSASARFDGNNLFENTVIGGLAIQILHTSNLRVQNGTNDADGNVIIGNNSAAFLKQVDVTGNIQVFGDSNLTLGGPSLVTGSVTIGDQSLLSTFGFVTIANVTCTGGPAGGVENAAAFLDGGGTVTGCTQF